jgi:hypothetical protein
MSATLEEMLEPSDIIVVGMQTRELTDRVCQLARPEQKVLDLVNITGREGLRAAYQGICW